MSAICRLILMPSQTFGKRSSPARPELNVRFDLHWRFRGSVDEVLNSCARYSSSLRWMSAVSQCLAALDLLQEAMVWVARSMSTTADN